MRKADICNFIVEENPDDRVETGLLPTSSEGETVKTGQITATVNVGSQAPPKFIRPNFDQMPPELKMLNNWVPWAAVWNGTKWTKRPIQISGLWGEHNKP